VTVGARVLRKFALGGLVLALLGPLVPLLLWSVSRVWRWPAIVPSEFTGRGYATVVSSNSEVLHGIITSTSIATMVAVLAGAIGLSAGRALGLYRFRGKRLVQFLMLAPAIVPELAVALGIQVFFIRYGLANTLTGVVLAHLIPTIPYVTYVMASVYANYDIAYEQQARVLGAGPLQVLRAVTLPAVFPGLAVACLFAFLISWGEYAVTLLVGGGAVKTLPMLLFAFLRSSDTTRAAAVSVVFMVPPLLLLALTAKYLSGTRSSALVGFTRL